MYTANSILQKTIWYVHSFIRSTPFYNTSPCTHPENHHTHTTFDFQDSQPGEIDLHGLYVKEAIARTEDALDNARRNGEHEIKLIVGQSHTSKLLIAATNNRLD